MRNVTNQGPNTVLTSAVVEWHNTRQAIPEDMDKLSALIPHYYLTIKWVMHEPKLIDLDHSKLNLTGIYWNKWDERINHNN